MPNFITVEPEAERYAADLLLVHGLWTGPAMWSLAAAGLAHRGWRCRLLDARSLGAPGESRARDLAAWCDRAASLAAQLGPPPVVIGHDAGGLVALALAHRGVVCAAVAVAPLLDGLRRLLPWPRRLFVCCAPGKVAVDPPENPGFTGLASRDRHSLRASLVAEPVACLASLRGAWLAPAAPCVPALLVALEDDPIVVPSSVEITARALEADYALLPGGHWPMIGPRADAWLAHLHRWIIRRAGASLLRLRGDEDLRDDT